MKNNRDYRNADKAELKEDYIIEGYATTFEPYLLFEEDGIEYFERIDKNAFNDTDFSDIILMYNHDSKVYARTRNKTLIVEVDNHGLKVTADLSKTRSSRDIFEEVQAEMLDKMSWSFTVAEERYDSKTRTREILSIKKIYDTSLVSRPQNEGTSVVARSAKSYVLGVEAEQRRIDLKQAQIEYLYTLKRVS